MSTVPRLGPADPLPCRPRRVLVAGTSGSGKTTWAARIAAVLDWEAAAIGPRELDLGWFLFFHQYYQRVAERYGHAGLPTFLEPHRVADEYEMLTGHAVRDLDWYLVYAELRQALERQRQVGPALVRRDGVNFVDDHRARGPEHAAAGLGAEQDVERLRRGHDDMRRAAAHALALTRS